MKGDGEWLCLTELDAGETWINMALIVEMKVARNHQGTKVTRLFTGHETYYVDVTETPNEIVRLLAALHQPREMTARVALG